jgi:hypothetical protein
LSARSGGGGEKPQSNRRSCFASALGAEVAIQLVADFINHLPAASGADAGPASR